MCKNHKPGCTVSFSCAQQSRRVCRTWFHCTSTDLLRSSERHSLGRSCLLGSMRPRVGQTSVLEVGLKNKNVSKYERLDKVKGQLLIHFRNTATFSWSSNAREQCNKRICLSGYLIPTPWTGKVSPKPRSLSPKPPEPKHPQPHVPTPCKALRLPKLFIVLKPLMKPHETR